APDQLAGEVLRVGRGAAVAEREYLSAGAQALARAARHLEQQARVLVEEALLEGDALGGDPANLVLVHQLGLGLIPEDYGTGPPVRQSNRRPTGRLRSHLLVDAVGDDLADLAQAQQPRVQLGIAAHRLVGLGQRLQVRVLDTHRDGAGVLARKAGAPDANR